MRRSIHIFTAATLVAACGGCGELPTNELILHLGLNVSIQPDTQAAPADAVAPPPPRTSRATAWAPQDLLQQFHSVLQQLQVHAAATETPPRSEVDELVRRGDALAAKIERHAATDAAYQASIREAHLRMLWLAARIDPDRYADRRDSIRRRILAQTEPGFQPSRASIQRYIKACLMPTRTPASAVQLLELHTMTYPDCEMNVELYLTTVQRFAAENRIAQATRLGGLGLQRCRLHSDVERLADELEKIYRNHPGAPGVPMNFAGPSLDGRRFHLKSLRGNLVLVVFWATWSPECAEELATCETLRQRYSGEGLKLVGVSLDTDVANLKKYVQQREIGWTQVYGDKASQAGWKNPIAQYYQVDSIPTAFLVDEQGVVIGQHLRGEFEIESCILDHLAP